jgi:hypothetical protein
MEIAGKIKTNLKDRINAVPGLVTTPLNNIVTSVEKLVSLQPVKAATNLVEHAGDGVVDFVNTQADITKRWMS